MTDIATLETRRDDLLEQWRVSQTAREVALLESYLHGDTMHSLLVEGMLHPGDPILTPQQIQREVGWGTAAGPAPYRSQADDYYEGRCKPFYENEADVQNIRGLGRYLAGADEMAAAILKNLRNYTVGEGYAVTVSARKNRGGEAMVPAMQEFVDEFLESNKWTNAGESRAFVGGLIDGEQLLWLQDRGQHAPRVRFVGGEHITQPSDPRMLEDYLGLPGLCWRFGVATDQGDYEAVHGYFVDWYGQGSDWAFIPESESVFIKRNVTISKRGIGEFYIPFFNIDRAARLMGNIAKGATYQASIAGIKQAPPGATNSSLQAGLAAKLAGGMAGEVAVIGADGRSASVTGETTLGGKIINTATQYMHGPMGSPQGPLYVEVYQGVARRVGSRFCMPEYMISSDASNGNYSSSLVAESPFIQSVKHEQSVLADYEEELIWKAIDMAARHGRFQGLTGEVLRAVLSIKAEPPETESRDPEKAEKVFDLQQAAGVLSAKTRAAKSGLDYEEELANGAKEKALPGIDPATGLPMTAPVGGLGGQQFGGIRPQLPAPSPRLEALAEQAFRLASNPSLTEDAA